MASCAQVYEQTKASFVSLGLIKGIVKPVSRLECNLAQT